VSNEGPFFLEIRRIAKDDYAGQAYNVLYKERSLAQMESFYLWLMEQLRLPTEGRLLDVACGSGEVVRLAGKRGLQATGIDISETVARVANENVQRYGSILVSMGEHLPFPDGYFDFVTNIGSLEHFGDPGLSVREMARVLRAKGKAFLLVPNTFSLLSNVWVAFRTGRTGIDHQPIQRYGARADWARLLESHGLAVLCTIKYEHPWPRLLADWLYHLRHPAKFLRLMITPFIPLNLAYCFLFTCERKE
jgi:ubiquinone/menaquinone biosynthesis C-methylase UbiE